MMKKRNAMERILIFLGAITLMVIGFIVIPPLIDIYAKRVYKAALKNEEIDFDNMGPEIIPNDKED